MACKAWRPRLAHLTVVQIAAHRAARDAHRTGAPAVAFTQNEAPYRRGADYRDGDAIRAENRSEESSADNPSTLPSCGLRQPCDITHITIKRGQFLAELIQFVGGPNAPLCLEQAQQNPVENIWQFMRDNWLSNRVFESYENIVDHCCYAWTTL